MLCRTLPHPQPFGKGLGEGVRGLLFFQIIRPWHGGLENIGFEEIDQPRHQRYDDYADELCRKCHDFLEPDNNRCAATSRGDSRLPESAKAWKTGNRMRVVGHGNLLSAKLGLYSSILTGASRNKRRVIKT